MYSFKSNFLKAYVGQGIYTQKKRNAYKINPQTGVYGNVNIDVPNLYGQLKPIAHKDGKKVYDKQVDFDTLDLLTKRFNSEKKVFTIIKNGIWWTEQNKWYSNSPNQ